MKCLLILLYSVTIVTFIRGRHIVLNEYGMEDDSSQRENVQNNIENSFFMWFSQPRRNRAGENYCTIDEAHTMCLHQGPSSECAAKSLNTKLSDAAKTVLVDTHNKLRSKIALGKEKGQPPAANMRKLVWNNELQAIAQRWADQCSFAHDDIRNMLDSTYVGQNLWMFFGTKAKTAEEIPNLMADAVNSWFDEVVEPGFNPKHINPFKFDFGAGHYTQVVWADTSEVGCGFVQYQDPGSIWFSSMLVCNYATGGNFKGAPMYRTGKAGSQCPPVTKADSNGLCEALEN